jgi:hypothetical protein
VPVSRCFLFRPEGLKYNLKNKPGGMYLLVCLVGSKDLGCVHIPYNCAEGKTEKEIKEI